MCEKKKKVQEVGKIAGRGKRGKRKQAKAGGRIFRQKRGEVSEIATLAFRDNTHVEKKGGSI